MTIERVRLGEVLELRRRPVPLQEGQEYARLGIYSWGRGTLHREPAPAHEMGSLRYFEVPLGALIVSNIQAWEGALAVTDEADANCVASNRFFCYLPRREGEVLTEYALQYLLSDDGFDAVKRASPGTQVRNRTLKVPEFERIVIPLPFLEEQQRVIQRMAHIGAVQAKARERMRLIGALLPAARNELFSRYA